MDPLSSKKRPQYGCGRTRSCWADWYSRFFREYCCWPGGLGSFEEGYGTQGFGPAATAAAIESAVGAPAAGALSGTSTGASVAAGPSGSHSGTSAAPAGAPGGAFSGNQDQDTGTAGGPSGGPIGGPTGIIDSRGLTDLVGSRPGFTRPPPIQLPPIPQFIQPPGRPPPGSQGAPPPGAPPFLGTPEGQAAPPAPGAPGPAVRGTQQQQGQQPDPSWQQLLEELTRGPQDIRGVPTTPFERAAQNPARAQAPVPSIRAPTPQRLQELQDQSPNPTSTWGIESIVGVPGRATAPALVPAPAPVTTSAPPQAQRAPTQPRAPSPVPPDPRAQETNTRAAVQQFFESLGRGSTFAPGAPTPATPAPPAPPTPPAWNPTNPVGRAKGAQEAAQEVLGAQAPFAGRGLGGFPGSSTSALGLPAAPPAPPPAPPPSRAQVEMARSTPTNLGLTGFPATPVNPTTPATPINPSTPAAPVAATPAAPVNPTTAAPAVNPSTPATPSPALQAMIETQLQGRSPVATSMLGLPGRQSAPVPPDPRATESTIGRDTMAAIGRAAQQGLQAIEVPGYTQALANPERMGHLPANPGIQSYTSPPTSQPIGPLTASPTVAVSPPTALSPALTTPNPVATSQLGLPAPASPAPPFAPGVPSVQTPATPSPQSVAQAMIEAQMFGRGLPEIPGQPPPPGRAAPPAPQALTQRGIDPLLDPNPARGRQAQRGFVPSTALDPRDPNFMDLAARGLPAAAPAPGRQSFQEPPTTPAYIEAPSAPFTADPRGAPTAPAAPSVAVAGRGGTPAGRGGEGPTPPFFVAPRIQGSSQRTADEMMGLSTRQTARARAMIEAEYRQRLREMGVA